MWELPVTDTGFQLPIPERQDQLHVDAFTRDVARTIGQRDKWTCQQTGRRFQDGWLVDAAHLVHDRSKPYYNEPRNGRMLCRTSHLEEHIREYIGRYDYAQFVPIKLLATRNYGFFDKDNVFKEGLRTAQVYEQHPEFIEIDRRETIALLERYSLDPRLFINFDRTEATPNSADY